MVIHANLDPRLVPTVLLSLKDVIIRSVEWHWELDPIEKWRNVLDSKQLIAVTLRAYCTHRGGSP